MISKVKTKQWDGVREIFESNVKEKRMTLGLHSTFNYIHSPRHLLHSLSRYKFASKIIGNNKRILEVGCSDGFCTTILSENSKEVIAIDIDEIAIAETFNPLNESNIEFKCVDITNSNDVDSIGIFDAAVSMDVIEHIPQKDEDEFLDAICDLLISDGVCIIGTPNITASQYASKPSMDGHINLFDADRLIKIMSDRFKKVILFSMNDEVVHTGYHAMAHYLICVGIFKK
jgi:2-polyprenyl-3-methyl-5-hydroxy-6-metoxy-1,4-benzoquinol methylase